MQVRAFLLDYFQQNPGKNLIIPDNPLRIQDILRKAFAGSGFRLLLNGIDVLEGQMNATFFQVQIAFNKKNDRKGNDTVLEFLEFWQKINKLFKVFFDSTLEIKDLNNRSKKKISTPESQKGRLSGVNNRNLSQNQKALEKSLLQIQAKQKSKKSFVVEQTMLENMVSNFYTCVNKSKSNKDSKIMEKNIHKNINDFVQQLKQSNLPFSRLIYKLQSQLPIMKLTQQTSTLMKALIKQYKLHPQKDAQYSQAILRNILYEYSNPTSAAKTLRKQKTNPSFLEGEPLTPITTVNTLKIGKKQSQVQIYKRKLNQLFESFSMAFKNRKGLTFDQMTDQFKKMDLNSWMSLNKKFNTLSKLGTQQIHFIFKRFSHLGFLDFQRFRKAFAQLNTKLFGKDSEQGNSFFGFNTNNNQNNNKSVIHLPMIRNNSLKNQLTNLTSSNLNQNNSFLLKSMMTQKPDKSNHLFYNKQSNAVKKQSQREVDVVIQKINTKIKHNKTKL